MANPHSPLTCMAWTEFMQNPSLMYGLFQSDRGVGQLAYDPNHVTVLSTDLTHDKSKHNRVFTVETMEELQAVKHQLKTKPFLLKMSACFSHTDHYVVVKVTTNHRGTYAVLVNSSHSMISTVLDAKFEQATECMLRGEKFCIELDFSRALARFHAELVDQGSTMRVRERARSEYGRVYITNHTTYKHCFDCNALWCCLGLPIWCFTAPCYMVHRKLTCKDLSYKFEDISAALRTGLASGQAAEIIRDSRLPENTVVVQTQMNMRPMTPYQPQVLRQEQPAVPYMYPPPPGMQHPGPQMQQPVAIQQQPSYLPPPPYVEEEQQQQQQQQQQQPYGNQAPPAYVP